MPSFACEISTPNASWRCSRSQIELLAGAISMALAVALGHDHFCDRPPANRVVSMLLSSKQSVTRVNVSDGENGTTSIHVSPHTVRGYSR
jgi:hypothetical protein